MIVPVTMIVIMVEFVGVIGGMIVRRVIVVVMRRGHEESVDQIGAIRPAR